jgi:hypothetical protein
MREHGAERVFVAHNLSADPQTVALPAAGEAIYAESGANIDALQCKLPPHGSILLRVR